jgi:hypothetical protein
MIENQGHESMKLNFLPTENTALSNIGNTWKFTRILITLLTVIIFILVPRNTLTPRKFYGMLPTLKINTAVKKKAQKLKIMDVHI